MEFENSSQVYRLNLLKEFNEAPDTAWFGQATVAAVRCCSESTIERDRWSGGGVPFVKCGRSVRYRKIDIIKWLESYKPVRSTTQVK